MRLSRGLLVFAAIFFNAQLLHADSISPSDPQMIIARGLDQTSITTLSPLFEPVDTNGGGLFGFVNDTGADVTGLLLTIDFKDAAAAMAFAATNCSNSPMANGVFQNIFDSCAFRRHGHTLTITLTGGEGIANGSDFFIDLNDGATLNNPGQGNGAGGWAGLGGKMGNDFEIQFQSTPEPGTLALLVSGLAGLWIRRKQAWIRR